MPKFKITSAIICEQCRQELSNKWSLLGVFSGDILIKEFPSTFPISAFLMFDGLPLPTGNLTIRLSYPGGQVEFAGDYEGADAMGSIALPTGSLTVDEAGDLIVEAKLNDGPWMEATRRRVKIGEF
jgi:hypothetical protein